MYTFQDFEKEGNRAETVQKIITDWMGTELCSVARQADEYDAQRNPFIANYVKTILSLTGEPLLDFSASNNKIRSNFFHRLNVQRCTYSLGNGIEFAKNNAKSKFGKDIDTVLKKAGFCALIHGLSFIYTGDKQYVFKATEFAPLWDENDGSLRAGIKFWRLSPNKPLIADLYEEKGKTRYVTGSDGKELVEGEFKPYKKKVGRSIAMGEDVLGYDDWDGMLPIVPLWGSDLKQSTLIGMKEKIDCYDLVKSGFANDLSDVAEIYWLVENYGGMTDQDLARFRDRVRLNHIANVDTSQGGKVTAYKNEIPYEARKVFLDDMRASIYEDFGGLDVHTVAAGATNDHIDAAYQPMDENADDFEYQVIECVQKIGQLLGLDEETATPLFKRNRISNQKEQTEMVMSEAEYLDHETILKKLPNISTDEVKHILDATAKEAMDRFDESTKTENEPDDEQKEDQE